MKRKTKIGIALGFIGFGGFVALAWKPIAIIVLILTTPTEEMCGLQVVEEVQSPSKEIKAVMYQFDCGATTPFTTNISILSPESEVKYEPGNTFSAYHGSISGEWGGPQAQIKWLDDKALSIKFVEDAVVTNQSENAKGIKVEYGVLPIHPAENGLQGKLHAPESVQ